MRVFVHGAGRAGRDAWPGIPDEGATFLDLSGTSTHEKVEAVSRAVQPSDTVVAHSAGALPVALAVRDGRVTPRLLVLLEPALYDVARGHEAIERHISVVTVARRLADDGDLWGFWATFRPLMFGGPAEREQWDAERERAARFAAVELPWGHGLRAAELASVPTVVVTGGWNAEYEVIAAVLARHGARHVRLDGHSHRPQDHEEFLSHLARWESEEVRYAHRDR